MRGQIANSSPRHNDITPFAPSAISPTPSIKIGWKLGRVISVMDRGFTSDENARYLQRTGGHYILGEKLRSSKEEVMEAMARPGRYQKIRENLEIKEIIVGDGEARTRYVLAYNPLEARRQKAQRTRL